MPSPGKKARAGIVLLLAFIFLFLFLNNFPVYPDEEQWLFVNSRQWIDHSMQYLFPVCQNGFQISQPILWAPIRGIEWLLYSHFGLIQHIRIAGIVQAIIFIVVFNKFLQNYARQVKFAQILGLVTASIGLVPFLLVLNRPEQQLILLFFCSLNACQSFFKAELLTSKILLGTALAFLVASMPAVHPKGSLFSLASIFVLIYLTRKKSLGITLPVAAIGLFSSLVSTQVWSIRTECKESNFLNQIFQTITINPTKLNQDLVRMVAGNIFRTPKYLLGTLYQTNYQSNWLAQDQKLSLVVLWVANLAFLAFVTYMFAQLFKQFLTIKKSREKFGISEIVSILFILMFLILTVLQRTKNFYDAYIPIILLTSAAIIVQSRNRLDETKRLKRFLVAIVVLTIPAFIGTSTNFGTDSLKSQKNIYHLIIEKCKISDVELTNGGFLIDNSLSRSFWNSPRFIYSGYVWGWWAQDVDSKKLIQRLKPPVIIVRDDGTLTKESSDVIISDFLCRNPGL